MPFYTQKKGSGGSGSNPQTPSGTVDGVNATFTVILPVNNVFLNEGFQTPNIDYTLSGTTIIFTVPPVAGSILYIT